MTRREIYFYDKENSKLYVTPEFNGDKEEFKKFNKYADTCDKNWKEIIKEFENIKSIDEFKKASNKAQSNYHSFLGDTILPIEEAKEIKYNDEVYMINEKGNIYLYNPKKLDINYLFNIANKGKFKYQELIMEVEKFTSKYTNSNIYQLNIDEVRNISTKKTFRLGALEDLEFTSKLSEFLDNEVNSFINIVAKMRENIGREPLKLQLVCSPTNNFNVAFEDNSGIKYVVDEEKEYFSLIKLDPKSLEPAYNLNFPIDIEGKVLYPIYDGWLGEAIFDLNGIDIEGLTMAAELNDYKSLNEGILDDKINNSNLNYIFHNIYNIENIEKEFLEKYQNNPYTNELREKYHKFLIKRNIVDELTNKEDGEEEYGPNN